MRPPLGKGGARVAEPARVESAKSKKRAFSSPFPSVARNCFTCFFWTTRGALEIPHTAGDASGVFFPPSALGSPSALAGLFVAYPFPSPPPCWKDK